MASAVADFQNRDGALNSDALLLRKVAGAKIVQQDQIRIDFSREYYGAQFSEAKRKAARLNFPQSCRTTNLPHLDPLTFRNFRRTVKSGPCDNNLGVDLSRDR